MERTNKDKKIKLEKDRRSSVEGNLSFANEIPVYALENIGGFTRLYDIASILRLGY